MLPGQVYPEKGRQGAVRAWGAVCVFYGSAKVARELKTSAAWEPSTKR
jgi:hypothetical protein